MKSYTNSYSAAIAEKRGYVNASYICCSSDGFELLIRPLRTITSDLAFHVAGYTFHVAGYTGMHRYNIIKQSYYLKGRHCSKEEYCDFMLKRYKGTEHEPKILAFILGGNND